MSGHVTGEVPDPTPDRSGEHAPRSAHPAPRAPLFSAAAVLRAVWQLNVVEEMQYRGNFVASVLGTLFWMAMALLTVALFFSHTDRLGGWDFWEVVALLGVFNALSGIIEAVLRPGIGRLAEDVRSGKLDLILTRPVEPQFYLTFRRLDIWRLADVVLGLALVAYAVTRLGDIPSLAEVLAFLLALFSAAAVVYSIWLALMSLAFWFVAVENLSVLFDAVYEAARYPVTAYPGALRFLFVYLIPIAWTTTIPASTLTGRLGPATALGAAAVGALTLVLTRLLWRSALRRYTSAGG